MLISICILWRNVTILWNTDYRTATWRSSRIDLHDYFLFKTSDPVNHAEIASCSLVGGVCSNSSQANRWRVLGWSEQSASPECKFLWCSSASQRVFRPIKAVKGQSETLPHFGYSKWDTFPVSAESPSCVSLKQKTVFGINKAIIKNNKYCSTFAVKRARKNKWGILHLSNKQKNKQNIQLFINIPFQYKDSPLHSFNIHSPLSVPPAHVFPFLSNACVLASLGFAAADFSFLAFSWIAISFKAMNSVKQRSAFCLMLVTVKRRENKFSTVQCFFLKKKDVSAVTVQIASLLFFSSSLLVILFFIRCEQGWSTLKDTQPINTSLTSSAGEVLHWQSWHLSYLLTPGAKVLLTCPPLRDPGSSIGLVTPVHWEGSRSVKQRYIVTICELLCRYSSKN